jgi:hypothetical protein
MLQSYELSLANDTCKKSVQLEGHLKRFERSGVMKITTAGPFIRAIGQKPDENNVDERPVSRAEAYPFWPIWRSPGSWMVISASDAQQSSSIYSSTAAGGRSSASDEREEAGGQEQHDGTVVWG